MSYLVNTCSYICFIQNHWHRIRTILICELCQNNTPPQVENLENLITTFQFSCNNKLGAKLKTTRFIKNTALALISEIKICKEKSLHIEF